MLAGLSAAPKMRLYFFQVGWPCLATLAKTMTPRVPNTTCWGQTVKGFQAKGNCRRVLNVHRSLPTRIALLNRASAPARRHL